MTGGDCTADQGMQKFGEHQSTARHLAQHGRRYVIEAMAPGCGGPEHLKWLALAIERVQHLTTTIGRW